MKPIDLILVAAGREAAGRQRRDLLRALLSRLEAVEVHLIEDDSPSLADTAEALSEAWILASPAASSQAIEAARRFPSRTLLLADLAQPLDQRQEAFWKENGGRLARVLSVSESERQAIVERWGLDRETVRRIGLGLKPENQPGPPAEEPDAPQPFQLDLLERWRQEHAAVIDDADPLRRGLCFESGGGVAVPARRLEEARRYLRDDPRTAHLLGRQGRLYVATRHHPQSSARSLQRLLGALPARRCLAGRKVAIYTPSFLPYDAVSNYVVEKCRLLQRWGMPFTLHVQDHLKRRDFAANLRPVSDPDTRADIEFYEYPGYYPAVERLRRKRPDVLRVFEYHGVTPSALWPDDSLEQSERRISLGLEADVVFTHSRFSEEFLREERGFDPQRMIRFPYSVDLSAFAPRPPDLELLESYGIKSGRVLLYVGRMAPNKRIDVLVEGLAHLPEDCSLILAGNLTDSLYAREADKARRIALSRGLDSRVIFTGSISDSELRRLYDSAHLFVSASLHEGFGIPFIEAMASGLPSVGSQAASIPEVIGEAGLTFRPGDPRDFARQAGGLLQDPSAYERAAEAGLRQVQLYNRQSLSDHLALSLARALDSWHAT
ncbi:MAG TPA: glycosyltransferase [Acidobacteriota bacterium]|nr:glycosyltransferase [Acidobacteriota bacterium]